MRNLMAILLTGVAFAQQGRGVAPQARDDDDEPRGAKSDEPAAAPAPAGEAGGTGEPGDEPGVAEPMPVVAAEGPLPENVFGAGVRLRYVTIPHWLLSLFTDASTQLHSWAVAGEFSWWKTGRFTLLSSLELGFYAPADGNWLGNGEDPGEKTDYVQFRGLKMVSVDTSFVWDHDFSPLVSLVWGAGLGLMFPIGDVWRASSEGCTADNADSETDGCLPPPCDAATGLCSESDINGLVGAADPFMDDRGAAFEQDMWPVYPVLNLMIGVRFNLNRHFQARVDTGFHNAFFFGAAGTYLF